MALTAVALLAHVAAIMKKTQENQYKQIQEGSMLAALAYRNLGVDEAEAGFYVLRQLYMGAHDGMDPLSSSAQKHEFLHWIDRVAAGEGFEP